MGTSGLPLICVARTPGSRMNSHMKRYR